MSDEKKVAKLQAKIDKIKDASSGKIPARKMGMFKKLLIGLMGTGAGREALNQIESGKEINLKKIGLGGVTGPITVPRDLGVAAVDYMKETSPVDIPEMNMGGMMKSRKKNMGLKMNVGGMVPGKFKGFSKLPESVQENMSPSLAKKYNKGGAVKKRAKSKPKARGTGAAIRGTKFKGVF